MTSQFLTVPHSHSHSSQFLTVPRELCGVLVCCAWNVWNVRRVASDGELRCQVIVGDEIANRVKQVAGSSLGVENLY